MHCPPGLLSLHKSRDHVRISSILFQLSMTVFAYSTPETFDIVSNTIDIGARKNLAQVSKVLTQITGGRDFGDDMPAYIPINDFVRKSMQQVFAWLLDGEYQYCFQLCSRLLTVVRCLCQWPMFRMLRRNTTLMSSWTLLFSPNPSTSRPMRCTPSMLFSHNIWTKL